MAFLQQLLLHHRLLNGSRLKYATVARHRVFREGGPNASAHALRTSAQNEPFITGIRNCFYGSARITLASSAVDFGKNYTGTALLMFPLTFSTEVHLRARRFFSLFFFKH